MTQTQFDLPAKCRIGTVTIKETFGFDESEARIAAENNGSDVRSELVDLSIVAVDGTPCLPGASGFDRWPTKTRAVVVRFFESINDADTSILASFIEEAEENGTEMVDGELHTKYELPKGAGLKFVVLKEMMEEDERAAAASGGNLSEVMIARCIVKTDKGSGFTHEDLRKLNTKTRNILTVYWSGMNFVSEDELAPLIKAAEAAKQAVASLAKPDVADSEKGSSPSGSGLAAPTAVA